MYCKYCGTVIDDDSVFCAACGKKQHAPSCPPPQAQQAPATTAAPRTQPSGQPHMVKSVPITRPAASVSFGEAIARYYQNYINFEGRAVRSEYWYVWLYSAIINVALYFFSLIYYTVQPLNTTSLIGIYQDYFTSLPFVISLLLSLVHFLPGIALLVRRLHDTGRSGAWWFITLLPLVGGILILIWMCEESDADNEWGRSPYGPATMPVQAPLVRNPMDFSTNASHKWTCVNCGAIVSSQNCPNCRENSLVKKDKHAIPADKKMCKACGEYIPQSIETCTCGGSTFLFPNNQA